ncbi:MAG: MarC family protein [Pseudomonadota bacterium]
MDTVFATLGLPSETLIAAITTLVVVVDPLGLAPIFLSVTTGASSAQRRRTAQLACLIAFLILAASIVGGAALLSALGISLPAFRVAGGLLLFYTAFEMVFERRSVRKGETAEEATEGGATAGGPDMETLRMIAAFPLAIPLMAGPGAIAACILLADQIGQTAMGTGVLIGIAGLVCLACLVVFLLAGPIDRLLGSIGRTVLSRLLGVILAALAVQFIADGVLRLSGTT